MKTLKKTLALLLALCVVLSLGATAFASEKVVTPENGNTSVTKEFGDLTLGDAGYGRVLQVETKSEGSEVTVNAGNISATPTGTTDGSYGLFVTAEHDGSQATVEAGDVTMNSDVQYAWDAVVIAKNGGTADLTVGDLSTSGTGRTPADSARGIYAETASNGTVNVEAGDVTAIGTDTTHKSFAVTADAKSGTINVDAENLSASGGADAYGVRGRAYNGSDVTISTDDITATTSSQDKTAYAAHLTATEGSQLTLVAEGDLNSNGYGIYVNEQSGNGTIDALVTGEVSGDKGAVALGSAQDASSVSLTLWKAELNDGNVVKQDSAAAAEVEANILYILKMDDEAEGTVKLFGVTDSHGYDCAKEDEIVTFGSADSSQNVVAVFNNGSLLSKDENGKYFLKVPKGGGVFLSFELAEIEIPQVETPADGLIILLMEDENEHVGLRLYADKSFVLRLEDGSKFFGTFEIVNGVIVFTMDGAVITATVEENGNQVFALPIGDGQSAHFTLKPEKLEKLLTVIG